MSVGELTALTTTAESGHTASIFLPIWAVLDDRELLAYYRAPRSAYFYPVADVDETRPEKIEAIMRDRFEFNGETHQLPEPIQWLANPSRDVEWHILLHKFYYAVGLGLAYEQSADASYAKRWMSLIDSWMLATPPDFIAADVTGRRVQNWIYSYYYFVAHSPHDSTKIISPAFHRRMLNSICQQVEYLCENLTPKRNHRTLELYAIFLAGVVFPEMRRAAYWRTFALEQTVINMSSDLLADGVHCEQSTDYHHLVLKNYLNFRRLAALNNIAVPQAMDQALQRALEFSMHVHKPDGIVPSLSDGDARSFLDLLKHGADLFSRDDMLYVATGGATGKPPAQRVAHFASGGYSVIRSDWGQDAADFADAQHLVFDCGPLGEGNHGHFDAMSFELAAFGKSLVVDPGRYTYSEAVDPRDGVNWRVHFRGTSAHNTVCIDGKQQTSYLPKLIKELSRHTQGSVRHKISGPAAEAQLLERSHSAHLDLLHGGVRSHEYDALHQRCIVFVNRDYWIVSDWLRAPCEHEYTLNFQLGAQAQDHTELKRNEGLRVHSPGLLLAQTLRADVQHKLADGWVSQRYGEKRPAPALRSTIKSSNANFDTLLLPWRDIEPTVHLEDVAVEARGANITAPSALRINLQSSDKRTTDFWFHSHDKEVLNWRIDRFEFTGRWVFWREADYGRVLHAVSHSGASLRSTQNGRTAQIALEIEGAIA